MQRQEKRTIVLAGLMIAVAAFGVRTLRHRAQDEGQTWSLSAVAAAAPNPEKSRRTFEQATRMVRKARETRVWGAKEAEEFHGLIPSLTQQEVASLLAELVPAMNRQEIRVAVRGAPF